MTVQTLTKFLDDKPNSERGDVLTPWLINPCQLPPHSSAGSSFSCFWEKKPSDITD